MRRAHAVLLTVLSVVAALLALWQCWYISLPLERASTFDLCRIAPTVDCLRSLYPHGGDLRALGVAVFPALAGLLFLQAALCASAWVRPSGRRESMLALASLVSFPVSGLAVFVLLNDLMVAQSTSPSAILVAIASLTVSGLTVAQGLLGSRLRDAGLPACALAVAALLVGWFLDGAMVARREVDRIRREREAAVPGLRWPLFARSLPRTGAAYLGDPRTPHELVVVVDPAQPASRELMRQLADLVPRRAPLALVTIYAPGEAGARLMLAHREKRLADHLRGVFEPTGDADPLRPVVERQEETWRALAPGELPAVLWKDGRRTGAINLAELLAELNLLRGNGGS